MHYAVPCRAVPCRDICHIFLGLEKYFFCVGGRGGVVFLGEEGVKRGRENLAPKELFCYPIPMMNTQSTHQELLNQAVSLTHRPPEETVDIALRFFIAGAKPAAALRQYRGKVDLGLNIKELREDCP
jgi:hypothetical protein